MTKSIHARNVQTVCNIKPKPWFLWETSQFPSLSLRSWVLGKGLKSWVFFQSVAIEKFDKKLLQSVAGITQCDSYYKERQKTITKCDSYYKA